MNYYIKDYDYEKHDLLVEEGDQDQQAENWLDRYELYFCKDNTVKIGYTLSLLNGDSVVTTFYNDMLLKAKDQHKLSIEEITIFIYLLINDTVLQSGIYLEEHSGKTFAETPTATPDDIIEFVTERMNALN